MKKSKTGKQYIQLLTDEEIEKRREESVILEIENLDNDNFKFIVNGKKLRKNFKKRIFTIDLSKEEKFITLFMLSRLKSSPIEHFKKIFKKKELAELKKSLEEKDNNALKNFIKKQGFEFYEKDIQESFILDYLYGLFAAYKNSETPKEDLKDIKKKLRDLFITPLTDKRGAKYMGFLEEKFKNDYNSITKKAKNIYRSLKQFCKFSDCAIKNYVKCGERLECKELSDYIASDLGVNVVEGPHLYYDHASKYRDATMCVMYNKNIKDLYDIKKRLINKRNDS